MRILRDTLGMIEIRQTDRYARWFEGIRLSLGNPGDVQSVGEGVSELRIGYGPGYRVYFASRGNAIVILLAGGDKRTQSQDIRAALKLARTL